MGRSLSAVVPVLGCCGGGCLVRGGSGCGVGVAGDPVGEVFGAEGSAVVVSLCEVAPHGDQGGALVVCFDSFGDGSDAYGVGELDAARDDRAVTVVAAEPADEGPVDFEFVDGEVFEVGQACVACSEVVDGQCYP